MAGQAGGGGGGHRENLPPSERLNVKVAEVEAPKLSAEQLKSQVQAFAGWDEKKTFEIAQFYRGTVLGPSEI